MTFLKFSPFIPGNLFSSAFICGSTEKGNFTAESTENTETLNEELCALSELCGEFLQWTHLCPSVLSY